MGDSLCTLRLGVTLWACAGGRQQATSRRAATGRWLCKGEWPCKVRCGEREGIILFLNLGSNLEGAGGIGCLNKIEALEVPYGRGSLCMLYAM